MNKTIKSGVRELLFRMISKFQEQKEENDAVFEEKQGCLRIILNFFENLEDVAGVNKIVEIIKKLTDLEQKNRLTNQNQYLEKIASLTGNFTIKIIWKVLLSMLEIVIPVTLIMNPYIWNS
ncbi:unnamed protein product [Diatraea saccharalis]|uniref:Uncharacterized protein n=1 Tax=Diatraea saccharalis TaxID=40085 RepID=A0A9N9RB52_9NEOP|nr:unnamed protein product [Diatraea saccharalis]